MRQRHVIIVGGGASGMVAAITAARNGAKVTLIEQKNRVGKKILSTGNGRCNFTNSYMDVSCFRGDDTFLVAEVLKDFGYEDTLHFFAELGVISKDRQGYVYPISDQATTILDVLRMELARLCIDILLEEKVSHIAKIKHGFLVKTNKKTLQGDAVILATGGKAASVLGSDGSGYSLAKQFGHHLSPVVPALVQLRGKGNYFKQVSGVRTNAKVTLFIDHQVCTEDTGELQLTDYGISGIPVFQISRYAAKALYEKREVEAVIDFFPMMSDAEFERFIKDRLKLHKQKSMEDFFVGVFHKKIIGMLLKQAQIPALKKALEISREQMTELLSLCKHFSIEIEDTNSFEHAQVCAGGVKMTEVNPHTMESIYAEALYLTGELLDVDGICGGYNLQWAWSTGYIAGLHAAKGKENDSNQTSEIRT